jgi:hypothetical protein
MNDITTVSPVYDLSCSEQLERVKESLVDKPPIYGEYFIPVAQLSFQEQLTGMQLIDKMLEAEEKYPEDYPQFRVDIARVTLKTEKRLRDTTNCIGSARRFDWYREGLSIGHHEAVWDDRLDDVEKEQLLIQAQNEELSCDALRERKIAKLTELGKIKEAEPKVDERAEALEAAWLRIEKAEELLRRCEPYLIPDGAHSEEDIALHEAVEAWLLGQ